MFSEIELELKNKCQFDQLSWINLKTPLTVEFYEKWLSRNHYGTMDYLQSHLPIKKDPTLLNSNFKSVITVTHHYFPSPSPLADSLPARTALYSKNNDYHFWLKDKLNISIELLKQKFPNDLFAPFVDSGPLLEKDYAYQAGHGWFGKNTCLIHPEKGSFFFIAEILTTLEIQKNESSFITLNPHPDMCGTCTRCMDICPTQALISPREMKADQCIAYFNIESKSIPPIEFRKKMNDWFFGCDLCQSVCPWNEKFFRDQKIEQSNDTSTTEILHLTSEEKTELFEFYKMILTSSNKQLQKRFHGTALFRASGFGLKRNALIVIANRKILGLESEIKNLQKDQKLTELCDWTLAQLN